VAAEGATTAAELLLDALHAHGVEYFFANAGTDFPPVIEAFARGAETARAFPADGRSAESVAVGGAGYYPPRGECRQ
jgi:acetolactate synthase-1/2/3 large subunit